MALVNIPFIEMNCLMDFGRHVALPYKQDKKTVSYIAMDPTGPAKYTASIATFERQYNKHYFKPLEDIALAFLRALKRAYLPGDGVADILLEVLIMSKADGKKELVDLTIPQLVELMNSMNAAAGGDPKGFTEKTFKTKKQFLEVATKMVEAAKKLTPKQVENKKEKQATDGKRLAGLERLKEEKAMQAEDKKVKKASAKTEDKKAPRAGGVGEFCKQLIIKNPSMSNDDVAKAAQKELGKNTSAASVACYRSALKKEGLLPKK